MAAKLLFLAKLWQLGKRARAHARAGKSAEEEEERASVVLRQAEEELPEEERDLEEDSDGTEDEHEVEVTKEIKANNGAAYDADLTADAAINLFDD